MKSVLAYDEYTDYIDVTNAEPKKTLEAAKKELAPNSEFATKTEVATKKTDGKGEQKTEQPTELNQEVKTFF